MKRLITALMAIVIAFSFSVNTFATATTGNVYMFDDITVEFLESSAFSAEEQKTIVQIIVNENTSDSSATYNVLCSLFGHKTTVETIGVIEHCVRDIQPKCLKSVQEVTACSRCDYVDINVITTYYINCCG